MGQIRSLGLPALPAGKEGLLAEKAQRAGVELGSFLHSIYLAPSGSGNLADLLMS